MERGDDGGPEGESKGAALSISTSACTPASGWEKGQVENQVGLVRQRFFTPRLRFKNLDELNAWLLDKCIAYAKVHPHPQLTEQTIWEVFEAERPKLVPYVGRFDGFHAVPASVSKTCLVRFDNNKYSVAASAVGRPVEVHAYADRIVIRQDGRIVAEHLGSFGRGDAASAPTMNATELLPRFDRQTAEPAADPSLHLGQCFLRLANLPNYALDRLSRYEYALWRQVGQILFALDSLDRRKPQERRRNFLSDRRQGLPAGGRDED